MNPIVTKDAAVQLIQILGEDYLVTMANAVCLYVRVIIHVGKPLHQEGRGHIRQEGVHLEVENFLVLINHDKHLILKEDQFMLSLIQPITGKNIDQQFTTQDPYQDSMAHIGEEEIVDAEREM